MKIISKPSHAQKTQTQATPFDAIFALSFIFFCRIRVESNDYVPYVVNEGKLLFFLNPKERLGFIYLVTSGGGWVLKHVPPPSRSGS